ncbi:endonuclease [Saccharibacillus sp. VR-M41]|uniref:Endonuclease n=2 Tax=Saccharibacillus alkalitolerans TaxID=2705290 RepID=A0ABX0FCH0_9BACL|nr:chitinase N-terminal domain-containing protein [Saccharibacillus alkalitolerans]NGZ77730.1 endonuclease [Saccharibacillus alkalitolerans]
MKAVLALSVVATMEAGLLSAVPASAETASDPAPFIAAKVVNDNAGKKVLFDNTHGQTAGAADWVIDGGFSDFGNGIAGEGYDVKELRKTTPITYADLADYDVFVVAEPNIPFKASEQAAMLQYVQQGGSIFFIGDHYNADRNKNRWDGSESINGYRRGAWEDPTKGMSAEEKNSAAMQGVESSDWLGENFGVRFRYNALGDINATNIVAPDQSFGITEGVKSVAMHAGSTLAIMDPTKAKGIVYLPKTNAAWGNAVDQGVYNGGGIEEGPYVAVSKVGLGKAAFIGDSSPVEDASPKYLREETGSKKTTYDGFKEVDDAALLLNTIDWLAEQENYTSLNQVENLTLDQPTALLPFEAPEASTEPQSEPWSAPAAGYKWWDPSTFKSGSYGSSVTVTQPEYSLIHQDQLPNAQEFQVRVRIGNLAPNATASGYSAGIYVAGGTQVAMVQNPDGTWPTSYGYSQAFSVTADAKGVAYKDLNVRIKPGTSGAASLRLRQNGTNLLTKSVTLANVPAQPLPAIEEPGSSIPELSTIAAARSQAEGTVVTLEGVVTTEPGAFGGQAFYLQDATGGIYVYQSESGFRQGDKIRVTAPLALYNTELELTTPVAIEKTGTAELPQPAVAETVTDANQGQLIQLKNVTVSNVVSATPAGTFEFDAVSETGTTTHVRVDGRTGLTQDQFAYGEGDKLDVTGVAAIFRGAFQLKPRGASDIVPAAVTEEPPGEEEPPVEEPTEGPATDAPAKPVLTDDNGQDNGLRDGSYNVTMNLWWGNNATSYKLYEEGKVIAEGTLKDASPNAQQFSVPVVGKSNGTYNYVVELTNRFGTTKSQQLKVKVTDASPGQAVLSHDNWDGDGSYQVTMNLWWGTNATSYELYENGKLIDTQALTAATPGAQRAVTNVTGKEPGIYAYKAVLKNAAGETDTSVLRVKVDTLKQQQKKAS